MSATAKGNFPRTIKDIVAMNYGAALAFPDGPPLAAPAPEWSSDGESEMDVCQREFFLKHSDNVPDTPLQEVLYYYDCIGFMNGEEAAPWLAILMCASFYAVDYLDDPSHNVTSWTQFALEKCMATGHVPVSLKAIDYFAEHVCEPRSDDPELHSKIDHFRGIGG